MLGQRKAYSRVYHNISFDRSYARRQVSAAMVLRTMFSLAVCICTSQNVPACLSDRISVHLRVCVNVRSYVSAIALVSVCVNISRCIYASVCESFFLSLSLPVWLLLFLLLSPYVDICLCLCITFYVFLHIYLSLFLYLCQPISLFLYPSLRSSHLYT